MKVGDRVKFRHSHLMDTIVFSARVVKIDTDGMVWVEIPTRVRELPFPPLQGKRYGKFRRQDLTLVSN